jgi:hypothetical protein
VTLGITPADQAEAVGAAHVAYAQKISAVDYRIAYKSIWSRRYNRDMNENELEASGSSANNKKRAQYP